MVSGQLLRILPVIDREKRKTISAFFRHPEVFAYHVTSLGFNTIILHAKKAVEVSCRSTIDFVKEAINRKALVFLRMNVCYNRKEKFLPEEFFEVARLVNGGVIVHWIPGDEDPCWEDNVSKLFSSGVRTWFVARVFPRHNPESVVFYLVKNYGYSWWFTPRVSVSHTLQNASVIPKTVYNTYSLFLKSLCFTLKKLREGEWTETGLEFPRIVVDPYGVPFCELCTYKHGYFLTPDGFSKCHVNPQNTAVETVWHNGLPVPGKPKISVSQKTGKCRECNYICYCRGGCCLFPEVDELGACRGLGYVEAVKMGCLSYKEEDISLPGE